ncbi:LysR family transcriptional regulator [Martelella alba]|uniref:LysR family transcriptional regulator n=1 Tax=Martelella alba TaxID=2590451 RepID=A0ABY2SSH7_9HYPH|nr:LysR family transcriptional regulator [Martelella alba]TKI07172.1 LysR family transcriptional regulator [Martelella alba]
MDRLAAMEIFVTVVETGSFTAAAKRLDLGQPAVSKIIATLELRLGVRLLIRSTRGLTPTEAGEDYYQSAKRAIDHVNEAEAAIRESGAGLTGRLRICAPVTFARLHILPRLAGFLERHPGLDIDVVLDDRHIDLIAEGIDVALRLGDQADSGLIARRLDTCRRVILGTPDYFRRTGEPRIPEDLPAHQAVVYTQRDGGGSRWRFRRQGETRAVNGRGRIRVSAAEGIRALVLSGLGLTMASEWMFAPELVDGRVVSVLNDWQLPAMDLWAVFPSGRLAGARARAFVNYLYESIRERPLYQTATLHSAQE